MRVPMCFGAIKQETDTCRRCVQFGRCERATLELDTREKHYRLNLTWAALKRAYLSKA